MKTNFKLFGSILIVLIAMTACEKSSLLADPELEETIAVSSNDAPSAIDSLKFGSASLFPLAGSLTNLVSEGFESGGQNYYCYHLKLGKNYSSSLILSNVGANGIVQLSYSINFKFFTTQENGPVDEEFAVELLGGDVLSYYKTIDKNYAKSKMAVGYLWGDRTFDPVLNSNNEYKKYWNSEVRLKSGNLHIKKSGEMYQVTFEGETETGEKVSCDFSNKIALIKDNSFESREEDFSLTEITENFIEKGGKYYKLNDGEISYLGNYNQTIHLKSWRDYYRYERIYWLFVKDYAIIQHGKSTALVLQFQPVNLHLFQSKVYKVAPSDGVYSIHPFLTDPNIRVSGFPNDSLCIGYYHIATEMPGTLTFDEDPEYMKSQIALKSGEVKITKISSGYEVSGSLIDALDEEVKVKFKVPLN